MALVGPGNMTNHPTRDDRLKQIKWLANKAKVELPYNKIEGLPMRDLYHIELGLENQCRIEGLLDEAIS